MKLIIYFLIGFIVGVSFSAKMLKQYSTRIVEEERQMRETALVNVPLKSEIYTAEEIDEIVSNIVSRIEILETKVQ